jgi:hypothetical protein
MTVVVSGWDCALPRRLPESSSGVAMSVDQEGYPSLVMRDRDHNTNGFEPINGNR